MKKVIQVATKTIIFIYTSWEKNYRSAKLIIFESKLYFFNGYHTMVTNHNGGKFEKMTFTG